MLSGLNIQKLETSIYRDLLANHKEAKKTTIN